MATKTTKAPTKSSTKTTGKKKSSISLMGAIPKLKLDMPLDAKKIKAIQRCLEKGQLTITVGKVDLAAGRIGDGWLYD